MNKINDTRIVKGGLAQLFLLVWLLFPTVSIQGAEVVDRIVAIVNDDIIRLMELNKAFAPVERQILSEGYPAEKEREIIYQKKMEALNSLIDDKLADQKIKEAGISVKESEIDGAIEQIKSMNRYSQEELQQALAVSGLNMAEYREGIRKQILRNKLISQEVTSSIVITQTEIQAYYDAHAETYSVKKKYNLRNIFMAYPSEADARKSVYSRMEQALMQLKEGSPFAAVAKEYSEAINASDGGELGFFTIDDLSGSIQTAVSNMTQGEFSSIIETDQGLQIFYVEEIADAQGKPVSEVADEIRQKLYEAQVNEKFKSWLDKMRKEAIIKIMY